MNEPTTTAEQPTAPAPTTPTALVELVSVLRAVVGRPFPRALGTGSEDGGEESLTLAVGVAGSVADTAKARKLMAAAAERGRDEARRWIATADSDADATAHARRAAREQAGRAVRSVMAARVAKIEATLAFALLNQLDALLHARGALDWLDANGL